MKTPCRALFLCFFAVICHLAGSIAEAQVRMTAVTLSTGKVQVTNFGAASQNLSNWWWCHQFNYSTLGGSIEPGETREFTVPSLTKTGSDLCLYDSSSFASTVSMQDFIQWGTSGNGRESVAVGKGIWTAGKFLTLPPAGNTYHSRGLTGDGVRDANWFVGWPTTGFPVPDISVESISISEGKWHIVALSPYLTDAHKADVSDDLGAPWQEVAAPIIQELGGGRIEVQFPAAGVRQFTKLRAVF
jgi:hypothetical protein